MLTELSSYLIVFLCCCGGREEEDDGVGPSQHQNKKKAPSKKKTPKKKATPKKKPAKKKKTPVKKKLKKTASAPPASVVRSLKSGWASSLFHAYCLNYFGACLCDLCDNMHVGWSAAV
jgi:hypothetical protein